MFIHFFCFRKLNNKKADEFENGKGSAHTNTPEDEEATYTVDPWRMAPCDAKYNGSIGMSRRRE